MLQELLIKFGTASFPDVIKGGKVLKTGMKGKPMMGISKNHSDGSAAVINNSFLIAYKLITEDFSAVSTTPFANGVYVEGPDTCFMVSDGKIQYFGDIPKTAYLKEYLPMMCYFLEETEEPLFAEFRSVYGKVRDALIAGEKLEEEDVFLLCDSFYHTVFKKYGEKPPFLITADLAAEQIKQLGRSIKAPEYIKLNDKEPTFKKLKLTAFKKAASTVSSLAERAKRGELRLSYEWKAEQVGKIPSLDELDLFIPSEDYEDALTLIQSQVEKVLTRIDMGVEGTQAIGNNAINLIFTGKPGTGKSTVGRAIAASLGLPFYCVPVNKNAEEDEFQGKTKVGEEGTFKFCETPFLEAFTHGGVVMLEEFNLANPGVVMGVLGQAIEKPYVLYRDGYEPVYRHPLCIIIATCNTMTQGAQKANEAFVSRCPATFVLNDPSDAEFINILKSQEEGAEEETVKSVYGAFKKVLAYLRDNNYEDLMTSVTLRHCLGALRLIVSGLPVKRAVKKSIVNVLALDSLEIADEVYENVIDNIFDD